MKPLNDEEKDILELLYSDSIALENFLIGLGNPRLLPFLNGNNKYNFNIFRNGVIPKTSDWKEHSAFWLPSIYLKKIAEQLEKVINIDDSIKKEYISYVDQALHNIIEGYTKENKKDITVEQMLFQIIKTQNITLLDEKKIEFMIKELENSNSDIVIYNIVPIIREMILHKVNIDDIKRCIEVMIESLSNEYASTDDKKYFIKEFLQNPEIIEKLSDICDEDFLLKLANILTQTLNQSKEILIKDEIKIKIDIDCSLQVSIPDTDIQFILPYVEFKDKEKDILPIIKKGLQDYNDSNKELLAKKILYWYTYVWSDLTYISYLSLYSKPEGYYMDRQGIVIYLLKELLLNILDKEGLEQFLHTYQIITSHNKYFIFKRILLYCYGKKFEKTRDRLFDLIEQEKSLLFSLYFDAEMYNWLQDNVSKFTKREKNKIDKIISGGPYEERIWDQNKLDEDTIAKIKRYWQQERYAPLKEVEPFKQKYENLRKQTQMKEFFNFLDGVDMKPINYKPLLTDMEVLTLLGKDSDKYIKKIIELEKKHPNIIDATMHEMPHPEGNADQLQRLASKHPKIITESINKFFKLKPIYICHILYGLRETKNRQNIKWEEVCSFVEKYVDKSLEHDRIHQNTDENMDDIREGRKEYNIESIIGAWADIIQGNKDYFNISEFRRLLLKYLKLLLSNYSFDYKNISYVQDGKEYPADYLTLSINTVMGRVLEKLIRIVLFENKQNISTLQDIYDEMLKNKVVEAHVFLGLYFIFFYQNIKEWTQEKSNYLLTLTNNEVTRKYWEMFFEGFIKSNNQYVDYYEWMYDHYKKAIELYNGRGQERLIDILTQFFELGKDELNNNSLLSYCWNKKRFHILSSCVRNISFSLERSNIFKSDSENKNITLEEDIVSNANKLWGFLWKQIERDHVFPSESSLEQKELFIRMLGLISALPSLNKPTEGKISQLIDCAETISWGMSNLLDNLIYLVEKNKYGKTEILSLARLYYKIIQKINYFTIPEQHHKIIELIKKYLDNSEITDKFTLIQSLYVNRKWNQYIDWFLN